MISNSLLRRAWPVVIQCAGASRKPRWLPVAKSKIYRIPKRPEVSEEERLELLRVNNNYKTQMRAVRRFYHEEMIQEKSSLESTSSAMSQRVEAEEWERCVALNEQWNAGVASERQERLRRERAALEEYALRRMEAKDAQLAADVARASEEIRRQKEISVTFITRESLDAALDHALANPTDYNYAIDLKGNQLVGRDSTITNSKEAEKSSIEA